MQKHCTLLIVHQPRPRLVSVLVYLLMLLMMVILLVEHSIIDSIHNEHNERMNERYGFLIQIGTIHWYSTTVGKHARRRKLSLTFV